MSLRHFFLACCLLMFSQAAEAINVQGDLTRFFLVSPGESFSGQIVINNTSRSDAKAIKVYLTDAIDKADGTSIYGVPAGKDSRSNASWLKFSPDFVQIPGSGKTEIRFEGVAPKNAEGSYWSMLMIEKLDETSAELAKNPPKSGQMAIVVKTRFAIRLLTNIKNSGTKKIKFLSRSIDEQKKFIIDIENTGTLAFTAKLWVELFNQQGQTIGKYEAERTRGAFPGSSHRFHVDLSSVPPGKYTALCAVDAGDDDIFGARYQIEVK